MAEHLHTGPNSRTVAHNHQHGDVSHTHGELKPLDRWSWSRVAVPAGTCVLCGEPMPRGELNRAGECTECTDAAEAAWGF